MRVLQSVARGIGVVGMTLWMTGCVHLRTGQAGDDRFWYSRGPRGVEISDYGWLPLEQKTRRSRIAFRPNFTLKMEGFAHDEFAEQRYQDLLDTISRVPLNRIELNSIMMKEISLEWFAYVDYAHGSRKHAKVIFAFSRMYNEWIAMYSDANTLAH